MSQLNEHGVNKDTDSTVGGRRRRRQALLPSSHASPARNARTPADAPTSLSVDSCTSQPFPQFAALHHLSFLVTISSMRSQQKSPKPRQVIV